MSRTVSQLYEFGPFRLDATERVLFRDGKAVALKPKVFDTLLLLVRNSGHVVEKDELMGAVWPDTVVEENNLNQNISALRRVLGESEESGKYIETLPRRGYRFVAGVSEIRDESVEIVVDKRTLSTVVIQEEADQLNPIKQETQSTGDSIVHRQRVARWLVLACVVLAVILAAVVMMKRNSAPSTVTEIRSIAVLPFKSLSPDSGDEYLGLGFTDALITRLSSINQIVVRPTSAVRKFSSPGQDSIEAGLELKVQSVLEGSIQKLGDRIRFTLQLINVEDGRNLWTQKLDEKFTDILAVEDSISEQVATALELKLTGQQKQLLAKRYTDNNDAYMSYLKGRFFLEKRSDESSRKAADFFRQAIAADRNYALAYTGLADYYLLNTLPGDTENLESGMSAIRRALELDDSLAEAHTSMAYLHWFNRSAVEAESEFTKAIRINPNYAPAHHWHGLFLLSLGKFDESIAEIKLAEQLDPISPIIMANVGRALYQARRYDEALAQCQKTLEAYPDFVQGHLYLAWIYDAMGKYQQALSELQYVPDLHEIDYELATLGHALALSPNKKAALGVLDEMKALARRKYVRPYDFAVVYAALGDNDRALEWLEKALDEKPVSRQPTLYMIKFSPLLDSIRSDPRFSKFTARYDMPE